MAKVDLSLINTPPQKSVIEHCKSLLEKAESGEIQGIAYATLNRGAEVANGFSDITNANAVVGSLLNLQMRIMYAEDK